MRGSALGGGSTPSLTQASEIEDLLLAHGAISDAAAVGIPSEEWGEAVKAVVVLKENISAEEAEIISHCKELVGFKAPKSVDFIAELPKSGSGKILKRMLRDKYWAGQDRQVN